MLNMTKFGDEKNSLVSVGSITCKRNAQRLEIVRGAIPKFPERDDEGLDQGRDGGGREETVELTALDNW